MNIQSNDKLFYVSFSDGDYLSWPTNAEKSLADVAIDKARTLPEFQEWYKANSDPHDPDNYVGMHLGFDCIDIWFYGNCSAPTFEKLSQVL